MLHLRRRARPGGFVVLVLVAIVGLALAGSGLGVPGLASADESPDLAVLKQVQQAAAGEPLVFSVRVTNLSDHQATGVVVSDTLPPEVDGSSAVIGGPDAASCSVDGQDVECDAGTIGSSDTFEITITTDGLDAGETVTNCATATSAEADLDPANNSDCATATVAHRGPEIVASGPGVIPAKTETFDIVFATAGTVAEAYSGYRLTFNAPFTMAVEDLSVASGLWEGVSCSGPAWTTLSHPNYQVPLGVAAATFECMSTGGATTMTGALARVTFTGNAIATYHLTMLSVHAPDDMATHSLGTATLDAVGSPQFNDLACAGLCGLDPPHPLARPESVRTELVAPQLQLSRQAGGATIVSGQEVSVDYSAENTSATLTATGVVMTVDIGDFVPESTTLHGAGAGSCELSGTAITCDVGELPPLAKFEFSIHTAAPSPWPPWDAHGWLHNDVQAQFNEWSVNPIDWGAVFLERDSDGDGYSDVAEQALGTDDQTYCQVMRADVNHDGFVTATDLAAIIVRLDGTVPPVAGRYDQGPFQPDGVITALDLAKVIGVLDLHVADCD